ncbi:hypothetical protein HMPREF1493_0257 [Atopobium sp. ICM42b]|nr:hypothetical protein HMPREF1493_0257 [Atopobium sp. ICM42b]
MWTQNPSPELNSLLSHSSTHNVLLTKTWREDLLNPRSSRHNHERL